MSFKAWNVDYITSKGREPGSFDAFHAGWAESEAEIAALKSERDALREALQSRAEELHVDQNGSGLPLKGYADCHGHVFEMCTSPKCTAARLLLSTPASGEPARKP